MTNQALKDQHPRKTMFFVELNVNANLLVMQVLADSVGVPCQLVKGQLFTTSDDVAMNIVKIDDGRWASFCFCLFMNGWF